MIYGTFERAAKENLKVTLLYLVLPICRILQHILILNAELKVHNDYMKCIDPVIALKFLQMR